MDSAFASVSSATRWAQGQFGSIDLCDLRLNRRLLQVAAAIAADPSASLPAQTGSWKATKAAYRMFDQTAATFTSLSQGHWRQTRAAAQSSAPVVLLIQDTTWLDFGSHGRCEGLGWCLGGKSKTGDKGLFLHSVLAVTPPATQQQHAQVLGLMHAKLWAREGKPIGRGHRRKATERDATSESLRWSDAVRELAGPDQTRQVRWIHVGDREADIFKLYRCTTQLADVGFVIRVKQNRNARRGHDAQTATPSLGLKQLAKSMPEKGKTTLAIKSGSRPEAKLSVGFAPVTLPVPLRCNDEQSVCCWCVRVWEQNPPIGEEAIEWILLSSEPVNTAQQALQMTRWYSLRWLIEEYHQCLKTGFSVEKRQLQSIDRLSALIGMLTVVAVRLLQMKMHARVDGRRSPQDCGVAEGLVQTLAQLKGTDAKQLSMREFVRELASLGGFLGRRSDGEPGWRTLWRGWNKLSLIHQGFQLAIDSP